MMRLAAFIFAFLAVSSSTVWVFGSEMSGSEDLDSEIISEMEARRIPSIVACIVKNDEIVWKRAYGKADIENNIPATSETIYMIASVSKLVVATAVMQLAERGLLDIDQDITDYLPFPVRNPNYPDKAITTRMLLTHSSGIARPETDYELPGFYDWFTDDSVPSLKETVMDYLIPGGTKYMPAAWKDSYPGKQELYSNLGVTLIAYLVEFISGEDFSTYCKNHIFGPLEMQRTSYRLKDLDLERIAVRYLDNFVPIIHYSRRDYPAGQLKSSADEFSHFLLAYLNGGRYKDYRILEESTIDEVLKIHNLASGLCLIWNCTIGGWYGHAGGVKGASSYVEIQRDSGVGLMIFSNVYLEEGNPIYPPLGKIYGLIRNQANKFRGPGPGERKKGRSKLR